MISEKRREMRKKILEAAVTGDIEGYIRNAEEFAKTFLTKEVIDRYVVPEKFQRRSDYALWLQTMLHNSTIMESFREHIVMDTIMGNKPQDYMVEEVKKGWKLGFY